jgi:hypothetical protein
VEHFRPKQKFPALETDYANLNYACNRCNDFKGRTWPSDDEIRQGFGFADPCITDLYVEHATEQLDGTLKPRTNVGDYTISHIRLNRRWLCTWRMRRRELAAEVLQTRSAIRSLAQTAATLPEGPTKTAVLAQALSIRHHLRTVLRQVKPMAPVD